MEILENILKKFRENLEIILKNFDQIYSDTFNNIFAIYLKTQQE